MQSRGLSESTNAGRHPFREGKLGTPRERDEGVVAGEDGAMGGVWEWKRGPGKVERGTESGNGGRPFRKGKASLGMKRGKVSCSVFQMKGGWCIRADLHQTVWISHVIV